MDTAPPRLDAKLLYRRLDSLFGALDPRRPPRRVLEGFLDDAYGTLRDDLRLSGGALYTEGREGFTLARTVGEPGLPLPESLDPSLPPLSLLLAHGVYLFREAWSADGPQTGWPRRPMAALLVGRRPARHGFFFALADGWVTEEVDFALNTVRAALGSRLQDERARGSLRQAAQIQQSLLLEEPPAFPGFDVACRTVPAEEVGGDFYDFYPLEAEMLGMAIGDASGHGLPAALQVRDVVTGLRMGLEKDLKVSHVFRKLNRVIHRSNLSSRFVSVFYGELEANGNLVYVNAGHPPALLFSDGEIHELSVGGTVVGPLPEAEFKRGIARMKPGDLLVMCTDGILERRAPGGEFLEKERLGALVRESDGASARDLIDRIFATAFEWGDGRPWEDDATALVVKRLPAAPAS
jgi:sigma-B regulation protein RsbU (phosphoserine phosphatase)